MSVLERLLGRVRGAAAPRIAVAQAAPRRVAYAVVDVETTGLSPSIDRILQLAVVRVDDSGRTIDEFVALLDPEGPVGATHIHGITAADVAGCPTFRDVAASLAALLAGVPVVAHNAAFDLAFLRAEFEAAGWDVPPIAAYCTLAGSREYLPRLARRRLVDCCEAIGYRQAAAHAALADARAAAMLLAAFLRLGQDDDALLARVRADAGRSVWPSGPRRPPAARPAPDRRHAWQHRAARVVLPALLPQVTALTLRDVVDEGAPPATLAYLELLLEAVQDGVITAAESTALAELREAFELSAADVAAAHEALLLVIAARAVDDGRIAHAERAELVALADLLDVPERSVSPLLRRTEAERIVRLSAGLAPLPEAWPHGEPLRVGDVVAFTGCDDIERTTLERRAEACGVRVGSAVSRRTALLVTDGSCAGVKLAAARELGTRIVDPAVFAVLLLHLQPVSVRLPAATAQRDAA